MSYRYIGNKTRVLGGIIDAIKGHVSPGGTVADLMCGTASVAEALKINGFRVIASDIMTYSYCHAWARLKLSDSPAFEALDLNGYAGCLAALNHAPPVEGLFFREYSPDGRPLNGVEPRKYLSPGNARRLDGMINMVQGWSAKNDLTHDELVLLKHDLVLAVNRVANIAGTYGHFRSEWSNGSLRSIRLEPTIILGGYRTDHDVLQGPAEDISEGISCDLCYLDPPYMKRQYAANYHLIETVARMDEPEAIGVSGLRPWRDQYSDFCSKRKIWGAFENIFRKINCPCFLISYSEDGLIPIDDLESFFSEFGTVNTCTFENTRFRSNGSLLEKALTEYLIQVNR